MCPLAEIFQDFSQFFALGKSKKISESVLGKYWNISPKTLEILGKSCKILWSHLGVLFSC